MSKFNELYKKIFTECKNIEAEDTELATMDMTNNGLSLKCEICGSDLGADANNDFACNDENFSHDHICRACAEKEAENYQNQFTNGEIDEEHILEFSDNTSEYGDLWYSCSLCQQLCPENELQETDSGMLCQDCINSLDSRGEEYTVMHNHNRY